MLPNQMPDWLLPYLPYWLSILLAIVGLMAITGIGSNIYMNSTWPFFKRYTGVKVMQNGETNQPDLDAQIDELEMLADDAIKQYENRNRSTDWWYWSKFQSRCEPELILAIIKRLRELEESDVIK